MSYKCCEGVRGLKFSRRYFLKQGGVAMVGLSAMPAFLQRAVAATPMPNKKQLVVLFLVGDRKSTRLNSSHTVISYAVFCLKKKTKQKKTCRITSIWPTRNRRAARTG